MTFTQQGDEIILQMTRSDFANLMMMLGVACGATLREDRLRFYIWLAFVNEINYGNPNFTPYEIPEEFYADPS